MERSEIIKNIIQDQRTLTRFMRQSNTEVWMDLALTIAQVKCMFFISNKENVNFRMLATALKVTPSNITGIIDRLVEQDLVARAENPEDRRMQILQLTEKGENLISSLRERRVIQMSGILDKMSLEELNAVHQGFSLLSAAIARHEGK